MKPAIYILSLLCFSMVASGQDIRFPNELDGYKLYGNKNLKDIQLLASSSRDVRRILGSDCEKACDYDENWEMTFFYLFDGWPVYRVEGDIEQKLIPLPDLIDKLYIILLRPKNPTSFKDGVFPDLFEKTAGAIPHSGLEILSYRDPLGLSYAINNEDYSEGIYKGNLVNIMYNVPAPVVKEKFIVVQEQTVLK